MELSTSLKDNQNLLKNKIESQDVTFLDLKIVDKHATLVFVNDLVNKKDVGELVIKPCAQFNGEIDDNSLFNIFYSPEKFKRQTLDEIITDLFLGNAVILVDGFNYAISFGLKYYEVRAITEPPTSTVLKGPREGFNESIAVNVSLLRRRLKSPDLKIEYLTLGKLSKTPIALCYIKGLTNFNIIKQIKKKLEKVEIDAILDSSYVSKFLTGHKLPIVKQVGNTEKPDILAAKMLEGRVGILVDGSPIALSVPYLLIEDFQSASDYYGSPFNATIGRTIRFISVALAMILPAFFVASELFHLQLIPLSFLLTIVNSIKGIPLSPSYEMFFTLLIFEILNEASLRMPKYVGMVVSIVGGLVLGETAVTAGIISAPTLMIIALSGISLYTVPELAQPLSLLRLIFLMIAGAGGAYGILLAISGLIIFLISFENFSTPLCAPFSPLISKDMADATFKGYIETNKFRPSSLPNKNKRRLKIKE